MFEAIGVGPDQVADTGPVETLVPGDVLRRAERAVMGQSRLEWERYTAAAQLHRLLVEPLEDTPAARRAVDPFSVCAAQLAAAQQMTQQGAEHHLTRALALRDRLPMVNQLLKEGLIAGHHIATIISRTDLIEGSEFMADIDRDIAEALRRPGSWSKNRLRDMVDATIFRRDPDLVRENRDDAKKKRGVWNNDIGDGMSAIDAVSSAEETGLIMARLEKLAMSTCKADPRRKGDRMADALFAVVMGREFYCQCPHDPKHPCTATITTWPAGTLVSGVDVKLVLHVIADQATVDGEADNPGYVQGHGVISGDHVRDIADRPETITRPMGNEFEMSRPPYDARDIAAEADYAEFYAAEQAAIAEVEATEHAADEADATKEEGAVSTLAPDRETGPTRAKVYSRAPQDYSRLEFSASDFAVPELDEMLAAAAAAPYWQPVPLPNVQPGNSYRPSTVLDDFLRIRDLYCMWPGCDKSAWTGDLDHTREYNHQHPADGGHTHPDEMKGLCRFHHLMKTYSDWLDDQYPDTATGRPRLLFTTPTGRTYSGPAWTGDDLFPGLRHLVFDDTDDFNTRPPPRQGRQVPEKTRARTQSKHARRHQERMRNRRRIEENPPPF